MKNAEMKLVPIGEDVIATSRTTPPNITAGYNRLRFKDVASLNPGLYVLDNGLFAGGIILFNVDTPNITQNYNRSSEETTWKDVALQADDDIGGIPVVNSIGQRTDTSELIKALLDPNYNLSNFDGIYTYDPQNIRFHM